MDKKIEVNGHEITITNYDKILYSKSKITKGDIVEYYVKAGNLMIPHIKDRPLTLHRFPDGIDKEGFYQKDISKYFPNWIECANILAGNNKKVCYVIANDKETLAYLGTQASLTLHGMLSLKDKIQFPDKAVIDIDPGKEGDFRNVMKIANEIRKELSSRKAKSWLMNTGSRGLHVVVFLKRKQNFGEIKETLKKVVGRVWRGNEGISTLEFIKEKREGRIFLDINRNNEGQLAVVPYSPRAREGAPVAAPLSWSEMNNKLKPDKYNIFNILKRKADPWKGWQKTRIELFA